MPNYEHILCFRRNELDNKGYFLGNLPESKRFVHNEEDPETPKAIIEQRQHFDWLDRPEIEDDKRYVQVVAYTLLYQGGKFAFYYRGNQHPALRGKISLGFGDHIHFEDRNNEYDIVRMATERTKIVVPDRKIIRKTQLGLIYDDASDFGPCHLGVLSVWTVRDLTIPYLASVEELKELNLEDWSRIALARIADAEANSEVTVV